MPTATRQFIALPADPVEGQTLVWSAAIGHFIPGTPSGGSGGSPFSLFHVNTDDDKLALTGLTTGEIVIIDQEGGRIEQYIAGPITDNASWAVLKNTVLLTVIIDSNPLLVNDVYCTYGATNVGWVDPANLSVGYSDPPAGMENSSTFGVVRAGNSAFALLAGQPAPSGSSPGSHNLFGYYSFEAQVGNFTLMPNMFGPRDKTVFLELEGDDSHAPTG